MFPRKVAILVSGGGMKSSCTLQWRFVRQQIGNVSFKEGTFVSSARKTLKRFARVVAGGYESLSGPSGGRHDFRAGPDALEVKGSVRAQKKNKWECRASP
jgi:hypothetical protein